MRIPPLYLFLSAVVIVEASAGASHPAVQPILFAATWTQETTNGINTFKFNTADGTLTPYGITPLAFANKGLNPTYVQGSTKKFSKGERVIYALNRGSNSGYVSAMTLQSDGHTEGYEHAGNEGCIPCPHCSELERRLLVRC